MKKIKYLFYFIICTFLFTINVYAASGSITASSSARNVIVGSTFTVTVKLNCSEPIGSWQFGISYDSSYVSLQSGDSMVVDVGDGAMKSKTYTYKFKAIKSGDASIKISSPSMTGWNEGSIFTPSTSGTSVTVKTQSEVEATYSKDNNLKSLSVSDYELSPSFSKDVTSYSVLVPETVDKVTVKAVQNDSTARISGIGEVDLSSGSNKVNVVVTAQNGSTKTYTINIEVKDINPIEIKVDNENFTVVKKAELLTCPTGFVVGEISLNDQNVPTCQSEATGFTLLGFKNSESNILMYLYNKDAGTYSLYSDIKSSSLIIYPLKPSQELEGFTIKKIKINDIEYDAYINNSNKNVVVIYGVNIETGNKGYFTYDLELNTLINHNQELFKREVETKSENTLYIILLGSFAGILFLLTLILARKVARLKKLLYKYAEKNKVEPLRDNDSEELLIDNRDDISNNDNLESDITEIMDETVAFENDRKKRRRK